MALVSSTEMQIQLAEAQGHMNMAFLFVVYSYHGKASLGGSEACLPSDQEWG